MDYEWIKEHKIALILGIGSSGLIIYHWMKYRKKQEDLPPGPWGIPYLGAIHQMTPRTIYDDVIRLRKQYGKVFSINIANNLWVIIGGYPALKEAFIQGGSVFAGRPYNMWKISQKKFHQYKDEIFMPDFDEEWKTHKKFAVITLRKFDFGLPSLENDIQDKIEKFIEELKKIQGTATDISPLVKRHLAEIISTITLAGRGAEDEMDIDRLVRLHSEGGSTDMHLMFYPSWLRNWYCKGKLDRGTAAMERTMAFIRERISHHKASLDQDHPRDVLDVYLIDRPDITEDRLCTTIIMMQVDAILTTAHAILCVLVQIMLTPKVQKSIHEELDLVIGRNAPVTLSHRTDLPYLQATILESFRFITLAPLGFPHKTTQDSTIQGYFIPKDTTVFTDIHSVHFDEEIFPQPEIFNPEHFLDKDRNVVNKEYCIPFSVGRRMCLGESLAKLEVFLFVANLLHRFQVSLPADSPVPQLAQQRRTGFFYSYNPYKMPLPEEFSVSKLSPSDAKFVNSQWKFGEEITENDILYEIEHLPSICIRNSSGELAAWGLILQDGTIGRIHTLPQYRKKGFAKFIWLRLAKEAKDIGLIPLVHMEISNQVSRGLFTSTPGCSLLPGLVKWVDYIPPDYM